MPIEVETKDCTALSDADLSEMADIGGDGSHRFEVGHLSKQAESWVLVAVARENGKCKGFVFFTLERIGGTPSVLIGLGCIKQTSKRDAVLKAIVQEQMRRAVLAFPDEDVLVGSRLDNPGGFEAYKTLHDVVPRPDHKATGEERAWGRRLAKRFGIDATEYEDRVFVARGDGSVPCVLAHASAKPEKISAEVAAFFEPLDVAKGDVLIAFGWAKAEDLLKFAV
jgi:hypothetical protein